MPGRSIRGNLYWLALLLIVSGKMNTTQMLETSTEGPCNKRKYGLSTPMEAGLKHWKSQPSTAKEQSDETCRTHTQSIKYRLETARAEADVKL
eukprot:2008917-Rhodomonas_salina.2